MRTQREFDDFLGVHETMVGRTEKGTHDLQPYHQIAIRNEAQRRQLDWDDRRFFEVPLPEVGKASNAA